MSVYNKYLWPIVVPTGGWDFDTNITAVVTIPAGTYDTILELCATLEALLDALAPPVNWEITVNEIGTVQISCDNGAGVPVIWTFNRAATNDDLEDCFGSDGTEGGPGSFIVFNLQHLHGYYPGTVSWGRSTSRGCGTVGTRLWLPQWPMVRTVSGTRASRVVGPVTPTDRMDLVYGLITDTEVLDTTVGLRAFTDETVAQNLVRFYQDRALGTVDVPGVEGVDYDVVAIAPGGEVRVRQTASPGFCTFTLSLNREP